MVQDAINFEGFKITETACDKIHNILISDEAKQNVGENPFIRFSVIPGGCKGMQYDFSLDDRYEEGDILLENKGKVIVVIDNVSLPFVQGSTLDYSESLGSSSFRVVNPNMGSGGGCGCGKSFTPQN